MRACAECGYETRSVVTCPACGTSLNVGSNEASPVQVPRVLGAVALNFVFVPAWGGTELVDLLFGLGANLVAAVLWYQAREDQLRRGKKRAAGFSVLMIGLSLLAMVAFLLRLGLAFFIWL